MTAKESKDYSDLLDRSIWFLSQGWSIYTIMGDLEKAHEDRVLTSHEVDKIIDEILSDKHSVIKRLLQDLKSDRYTDIIRIIKFCRDHGYDYPEFKTIEKSMKSELKESFESLDCRIDSIYYEHPYDSPSGYIAVKMSFPGVSLRRLCLYYYQDQCLVHDAWTLEEIWKSHEADIKKFALKGIEQQLRTVVKVPLDHQAILKAVLTSYKKGRYSTVEFMILASKLTGRNYPEFPAIEKSLKHVRS